MKKNTLLSILAISSTSVAAYADADLNIIKVGSTTDWSNASEGIDLANGIFTSTVPMSQTIGTLVPGKYILTADTKQNAAFTINGSSYTLGEELNVSSEMQVTIGISAASPTQYGDQFQVGAFKLTLVYDFGTAKSLLGQKLTAVINKAVNLDGADEPDEVGQQILYEASLVQTELNELVDGADNAYDVYKAQKLYLGTDAANLPLNVKIADLSARMEKNVTDIKAYNYVKVTYVNAVSAKLSEIETAVQSGSDYVKSKYTPICASYKADLQAYTEALDAAFAGGTVVADYPAKDVDKAAEEMLVDTEEKTGTLVVLLRTIQTADEAATIYPVVKALIEEAKAASADAATFLNELMADDIYANLLSEARKELNEQYVKINEVADKNGDDDNHDFAAANEAQNRAALEAVNTAIEQIKSKYEARVNSIVAAYANANALVSQLETAYGSVNKNDVKNKYATQLAGFETRISDFKAAVEASHADYSIDSEGTINSQKATADKILSDINTFAGGLAKPILDNYNAYQATLEKVKDLQKALNDAKVAVGKIKVEKDETYSATTKFAATAEAQQSVLNGYLEAAKALYEKNYANGTYTAYVPNPTYDATTAAITEYQTTATTTAASFNRILTAVEEGQAALKTLKETALDTDVTVLPEDEAKTTYGDEIARITKYYAEVNDSVAAANSRFDNNHVVSVNRIIAKFIDVDANDYKILAENLTVGYEEAKSEYDKNLNINAAKKMAAQAEVDIAKCQNAIDALVEKTDGTLGKSQDVFNGDLQADVVGPLNALSVPSADGITEDNASSTIALLSTVNETIQKIMGVITELDNRANVILAALQEIKDAKSAIEVDLAKVEEQLYGNSEKKISSVATLNEDPAKTEAFNTDIKAVEDEISTLRNEMEASSTEETFMNDQEDVVEGDQVTKEGFKTRASNLYTEVQDLRAEAVQATTNYKSKVALETLYGAEKLDISGKFSLARTAIEGKTTGDGNTYFTQLVNGYATTFNNIKIEIATGYNENKLNLSEASITNKLNTLANNLSVVPDNAEKNEVAYNELVEKAEKVREEWKKAYTEISTNYQQIDLDDILNLLTAEQTKLTAAKEDIKTAWGKGSCDTNKSDLLTTVQNISLSISNILQSTIDGYDAAIAKDNQTRYDAFLAAVEITYEQYTAAITEINKYYNIKNVDYAELIESIKAAHNSIYGYAQKISDLKDKAALEKRNATANHEDGDKAFYDLQEDNSKEANNYTNEIKEILVNFQSEISNSVEALYTEKRAEVQSAFDAAVAELVDYNASVINSAFGDVRTILADAAAAHSKADFPLQLDGILEKFATTGELLKAGKEPAAISEWQYRLGVIDNLIAAEQADMAKFSYLPVNTVDYDKRYADEVIVYRDAAVKIVKEAETLYGAKLTAAKNKLNEISTSVGTDSKTHTTVYNDAKAASVDNDANTRAIADINAKLDETQALLDKAKEFIDAMVITSNEAIIGAVASVQTGIDEYRQKVADDYAQNGGAVAGKDGIISQCDDVYKLNIANLYPQAISAEKVEITLQIELLKKDYNNATIGEGVTLEELEALKKRMEALTEALDEVEELVDASNNPLYYEQQKALIALELEIADIQNKLVEMYNIDKFNSTLSQLNNALAAVKEAAEAQSEVLAGCHANVQAAYGDELNGIVARLDVISDSIAAKQESKTLLFYADNITKDIETANTSLGALTTAIADAQKPYTINQNVYDKLSAELEVKRGEKETLAGTIEGYKYLTNAEKNYYLDSNVTKAENYVQIKKVELLIAAAETDLNVHYNSTDNMLTEASKLLNIDGINDLLETITKDAENSNVNNAAESKLPEILEEANALRTADASHRYTAEVKEELDNTKKEISKVIERLNTFNDNVYAYGKSSVDIDGNIFTKVTGGVVMVIEKNIDYIETIPTLDAKIAEIEQRIADFTDRINSEFYVLGDVGSDAKVYVDDYMGMINLVLNPETLPEAGSLDFLRADINEDGDINIGDVTKVAKVISGVGISSQQAKAYKAKSQQVSEDAVTVSATSTGANTYRIVLGLDNSVAYAGSQMDIVLPAGVTLLDESLASRASSHKLYSSDIDGAHRIVITSSDAATFADGDKALVYLDVAVSGNANVEEVGVTNIIMADANAYTYKMKSVNGNIDGTVGIEDDVTVDNAGGVRQKIYDAGGALINKLQKGINIIRNSDGTVKKVFKK